MKKFIKVTVNYANGVNEIALNTEHIVAIWESGNRTHIKLSNGSEEITKTSLDSLLEEMES